MSAIADMIRAGVDPDLIEKLVLEMVAAAAGGAPARSSGAIRQARYREKQRNETVTNRNGVTVSHIRAGARPGNLTSLDSKKERKKDKIISVRETLETCLSPKTSSDLIEHRKAKRSPLTLRAAELLVAAFLDHGEPERCAEAMIANGWQGFKPEWMANCTRAGPVRESVFEREKKILYEQHLAELEARK